MTKYVLEVGSSELLNHSYGDGIQVIKTTRDFNKVIREGSVFFDAMYLRSDVFYLDESPLMEHIKEKITSNKLDLMIFSIGVLSSEREKFHEEHWTNFDHTMLVNFTSIMKVMREVISFIMEVNPEYKLKFLFINSEAGLGTYPNHASYSISKAALHSLCENLKIEYMESNMMFESVYPPMVATKLSQNRGQSSSEYFEKELFPLIASLLYT